MGSNWATLLVWTSDKTATDYEYVKAVQPVNSVHLTKDQVPKVSLEFNPEQSLSGYYWSHYDGIGGTLTTNELVDYDLLSSLTTTNLATEYKYGSDGTRTNPVRNHCPFVEFVSPVSSGSTPDESASMDCDLAMILKNQYQLFYGSGTDAQYCV